MEYQIFTQKDLQDRTAMFSADLIFSNMRDKVVIQGIVLPEEYVLDHVAAPSESCPWGESYYRRL